VGMPRAEICSLRTVMTSDSECRLKILNVDQDLCSGVSKVDASKQ